MKKDQLPQISQKVISECVEELELLKCKVSADNWVNQLAQKNVAQGVQMSIDKLNRMVKTEHKVCS